MKTYAITHTGRVRSRNEDRYLVLPRPDGTLVLGLADGLGGHAGGEVAAQEVVAALSRFELVDHDVENRLRALVFEADRSIHEMAERKPDLEGMGATLTGVVIHDLKAYWVQVGDSRLYLVRDGAVRQITKDQSMLQFLLDEGEISEEQARTHPSRHLLDQCVGQGGCIPDSGRFDIAGGDLLMLSSDGLHGAVDRQELADLLRLDLEIERKARMLLETALEHGGQDNITGVIASI